MSLKDVVKARDGPSQETSLPSSFDPATRPKSGPALEKYEQMVQSLRLGRGSKDSPLKASKSRSEGRGEVGTKNHRPPQLEPMGTRPEPKLPGACHDPGPSAEGGEIKGAEGRSGNWSPLPLGNGSEHIPFHDRSVQMAAPREGDESHDRTGAGGEGEGAVAHRRDSASGRNNARLERDSGKSQAVTPKFEPRTRTGPNGSHSTKSPELTSHHVHPKSPAIAFQPTGYVIRDRGSKGRSFDSGKATSFDDSGMDNGGVTKKKERAEQLQREREEREQREIENETIVQINVSGRVFQTKLGTLRRVPGTLLANYAAPDGELTVHGHIFLDRDYKSFYAVLQYYRTDRLNQPASVPDDLWGDELLFYKIRNPVEFQMTEQEMIQVQIDKGMPPEHGFRQSIWLFFEDPASSTPARYQSIVGVLVIMLAVSAAVTQTMPRFRHGETGMFYGYTIEEATRIFTGVETGVVVYFTIELVCRVWSTTKKLRFWTQVPNWIDLLAILPFYIELLPGVNGGTSLVVVRIFRLTRIFRIIGMVAKLGKYSSGAKVMGSTLYSCRRELAVLGIVFVMAITIFASFMFFCENPDVAVMGSTPYESVLTSIYWAGITVTTVGYGDMTPETRCGQFVACMAAIAGVFCLGLPISVITTKFTDKYKEMLLEQKVEKERNRFIQAKKKIAGMRGISQFGGVLGKVFGVTDDGQEDMEMIMKVATKVFHEMDHDNSNTIDAAELKEAVKKLGFDLGQDGIDYMMEFIDTDNNGTLEFDEFSKFVEMVVRGEIPTPEDIQTAALKASEEERNKRRKKAHARRWGDGHPNNTPASPKA